MCHSGVSFTLLVFMLVVIMVHCIAARLQPRLVVMFISGHAEASAGVRNLGAEHAALTTLWR